MSEINTDAIYKQLKKQNGEGVAKVIREAVLLDVPNIVHILEFAGNNPEKIKQLVPLIREMHQSKTELKYHTDKNPLELLDAAGYDAFVVKNLHQQNSIKQYFKQDEELCTFNDNNRYKNYYIIHAVKKNVDKIKRAKKPQREDEYGTSVISIQILKTGGFISIKNRYNHTVNNPDATFNNNPDSIIPGLSESLKKYFNVDFNVSENELPGNFRVIKDQFVFFNNEVGGVYFGPDYYFSNGVITKLNKDYEIMLDNMILDTRNGNISMVQIVSGCTYDVLYNALNGKKIRIAKSGKQKIVFANNEKVISTENGQIVELNLPDIEKIEEKFMYQNTVLRKLNLPNVKRIGNNFLPNNDALETLDLPNVEIIGEDFLDNNDSLIKLNLPKVKSIGSWFLTYNHSLKELNIPNAEYISNEGFLESNRKLNTLNVPVNVLKDKYNKHLKMAAGKTRLKDRLQKTVNKLFVVKTTKQKVD